MSFVRIHTCLPATDEGRMNEYVWSDVAFAQTIVVYVPVVGSLPATFVAYANTKLSPSALAECRATIFKVNVVPGRPGRSEEHTSELQSRLHLVCRLLLEKKKQMNRAL